MTRSKVASVQAVSARGTTEFDFSPGTGSLADALARNGLPLNTRCGNKGLCSGCAVLLEAGALHDGEEQRCVAPGATPVEVLACRCSLPSGGNIRVRVPDRSLLLHPPTVVSDFKTLVPTGCDPLFRRCEKRPLGIAVDIGTTTVAALLADLHGGGILARATALNAQVAAGDNVLTRIYLCQQDAGRVRQLQEDFWDKTFRPLLARLLRAAGRKKSEVAGMCVAGNTTMLHLAAGVDPSPMGTVPFTPSFLGLKSLDASLAGLDRDAEVFLLPGISAYVGADIAAGAVCSAAAYGDKPRLLVDVGTNGEMLLAGREGKLACATAAGPAFEGSGLSSGMRAGRGAAGRIRFAADPFRVELKSAGNHPVEHISGIAGSAYVDFLFEARAVGMLDERGRFNPEFTRRHPSHFGERKDGLSFFPDPTKPELRINEVDVALLLQAKSAVAAGVLTLLDKAGCSAAGIERVYLAGGFGLHLSVPHAIGCGLLPGFSPAQVEAVGNTSLGGAYLVMLDQNLLQEMDTLREEVETIELNLDPEFENRYIDNLSLP